MFERDDVELVTISKSARKLKVDPSKHVVSGAPFRPRTFVTCATLTSLAVQFSASELLVEPAAAPLKRLYSFCKQLPPCANAGPAIMAVASSATQRTTNRFEVIHRNTIEDLVPMMVFLLVVCAHVYLEGAWVQNCVGVDAAEWQHRAA